MTRSAPLFLAATEAARAEIEMAWADSMRFRRRADKVRAAGWINLLVTLIFAGAHLSDGLHALTAGAVWASLVMGITYGFAWMLDRHAERVVRR